MRRKVVIVCAFLLTTRNLRRKPSAGTIAVLLIEPCYAESSGGAILINLPPFTEGMLNS